MPTAMPEANEDKGVTTRADNEGTTTLATKKEWSGPAAITPEGDQKSRKRKKLQVETINATLQW